MHEPASAKWTTVVYLYALALFSGLVCLWAITRYGQQLAAPDAVTNGKTDVIGQTQPLLQAIDKATANGAEDVLFVGDHSGIARRILSSSSVSIR